VPAMVIHSDSTGAIARANHSGAGPGLGRAGSIQESIVRLLHSTDITWAKGHAGVPGNERADVLAGKAIGETAWSPITPLDHLKLRISEGF